MNSFKAASPWSGSRHNEKNTRPWTPAQQMHPHIHIIKHLYFERAGDVPVVQVAKPVDLEVMPVHTITSVGWQNRLRLFLEFERPAPPLYI